jgi:hypothetical protein
MKNSKNIIGLSFIVAGIIVCWLIPGINKAGISSYERAYEDTWNNNSSFAYVAPGDTIKPARKVYRTEEISPKKDKKVNMKMFSRAVQFQPVAESDSLQETEKIVRENTSDTKKSDFDKAHSKK